MKKSEVRAIIANHLYHANMEPEEADIKADKIIDELVELGWNPPEYLAKGCRCLSCYKYNDWEDEE